jgi:hypothetical protein
MRVREPRIVDKIVGNVDKANDWHEALIPHSMHDLGIDLAAGGDLIEMPQNLGASFRGSEQDDAAHHRVARAGMTRERAYVAVAHGVVDVAEGHVGIDDNRRRDEHAIPCTAPTGGCP